MALKVSESLTILPEYAFYRGFGGLVAPRSQFVLGLILTIPSTDGSGKPRS